MNNTPETMSPPALMQDTSALLSKVDSVRIPTKGTLLQQKRELTECLKYMYFHPNIDGSSIVVRVNGCTTNLF
jgi:hypothetical protein